MRNVLILLIVSLVFYFFLEKNRYGCDRIYTIIAEEYKGIVKKKFIVKSDYNFEIQVGKNVKRIYGVNKEVDDYLMEGDTIQKIKGFNKCIVIRNNQVRTFQKYLDLVHENYCDSIRNIKK